MNSERIALTFGDAGENHVGNQMIGDRQANGSGFTMEDLKYLQIYFENNGLIHKVPDTNNLMRYSLCRKEECSPISHNHNHGHFICYSCNQTFCLEGVKYPEIISMKGFYVKEFKLTAEGYCKECYKN